MSGAHGQIRTYLIGDDVRTLAESLLGATALFVATAVVLAAWIEGPLGGVFGQTYFVGTVHYLVTFGVMALGAVLVVRRGAGILGGIAVATAPALATFLVSALLLAGPGPGVVEAVFSSVGAGMVVGAPAYAAVELVSRVE